MADGVIAYRILGLIGEGGFGKVYRARQESGDGFTKEVALKILNDDEPHKSLLSRFRDEARILGLIRDRAIVKVEPPIEIGGNWAVIMEFVDGVSMRTLIDAAPIPPGIAVELVGEVARAIHNAFHQMIDDEPLQLLHRDIKPDNIQVTPSGEVRLLDFGIAKANFAQRETKTRKAFGGTPGYIAPERPEGIELPAGDVYSLGVVLYEAVVGKRSVGACSMVFDDVDDLPRIDTEELDLPDGASDDLRKVVELSAWMRNADYDQRPSARQVEDLCRELRTQLPGPYLRDWAETDVPRRHVLPPDERVGMVYTVAGGTPAPVTRERVATLPPPPKEVDTTRIAMGGLMAGGLGLGVGLGLAVFATLVLILVAVMSAKPEPAEATVPPPTPAAPAPVPEPSPTPVPEAPAPVVPAPAPAPAPAAPKERVIVLPGSTAPSPAPAAPQPAPAAPVPQPAPTPAPAVSGYVVVRTVPSGATVQRAGQVLTGSGGRYELPVGSHTLTLVSPNGEKAPMVVNVNKGRTVEICYSFDTNSACAN